MARTYDYRYRLAAPGGHATCRVRVYREGEQTICLVTWRRADYAAIAPEARTAALAAFLTGWHHPQRDGRLVVIEGLTGSRSAPSGGAFAAVEPPEGAGEPRLRPLARAMVEALIGEPVTD